MNQNWFFTYIYQSVLDIFKLHQIVRIFTGVQVLSHYWVMLFFWWRILQLEVAIVEVGLETSFEHWVIWNLEYVKCIVGCLVDVKLKWFEIFWSVYHVGTAGIHAIQLKIFFWLHDPRKIRDQQVSVVLHHLSALG